MRTAVLLAALAALSGCGGPDLTLGTFNFTLTGTDTETSPNNNTRGVAGSGTMAVTLSNSDAVDYVITVAQVDVGPCVLNLDRSDKDNSINVAPSQSCVFNYTGGQVTATMTSGTLTLDEAGTTMTLTVTYSWAGTVLGFPYSGTGTRTYTGPRR